MNTSVQPGSIPWQKNHQGLLQIGPELTKIINSSTDDPIEKIMADSNLEVGMNWAV